MNGRSTFYALIVGFILSIRTAIGCSPRYREQLRSLDLYLGIQYVNGGLKSSDQFLSHYAREANQLDCNFEPSEAFGRCLWQNAPTDAQTRLDTVDFHMFRKTDLKYIPVQVRPGPVLPRIGNNFILAGDNTIDAQAAVFYSVPVACQKDVGKFSFAYWVYNDAKIEVLVLKAADREKVLEVLHRPEIDCNYFRPQDERCQVIIPPVDEPFQIGIRVYNLRDSIAGSFALIDDIKYTADICQRYPDFGPAFASKTLTEDVSNLPVITADELDCNFRSKCRWGNDRLGAVRWQKALSQSIDSARWAQILGQVFFFF